MESAPVRSAACAADVIVAVAGGRWAVVRVVRLDLFKGAGGDAAGVSAIHRACITMGAAWGCEGVGFEGPCHARSSSPCSTTAKPMAQAVSRDRLGSVARTLRLGAFL